MSTIHALQVKKQEGSGKALCRICKPQRKIAKGEHCILISGWSAGGYFGMYMCMHHAIEFLEQFKLEIVKELK